MKKTFVLMAAVAAAFTAVSCRKEAPVENPSGKTDKVELAAPVLSISPEGEIVLEEGSEETVAELSWTSAVPEGVTAEVSYTLYVNDAAADMYTSPLTFSAGSSLSVALKTSDLAALVGKINTETPELQFAVYAKPSDESVEARTSNTVKAKVSLVKHEEEVPETLYLLGSATVAGWDQSKAIPVTANGKVYTAEGVELNLTVSDTGFKFLFANDGSSTRFFGPDLSAETFGTVKLYLEDDGTANLFQPALNGYTTGVYTIVLDLESYMMTLTRTGDIEYRIELGDAVYALGDCFDWKWSFTTPMEKTADNVYEMKNVRLNFGDGNNGFKIFTEVDKWSPYFAQTEGSSKDNVGIMLVTDTDVPQFKPGLLGYETGTYDVKADFGAMKLTLTLVSAEEKPGFDETKAFYIYGGTFGEGGVPDWTFDVRNALVETPEGSGIYVSPGTVHLEEWSYFKFEKQDWTEYVRQKGAEDYWTAVPRTHEPDNDCTFSPGDTGLGTGEYKVTLDTNTGKVTLEKAE